MSTRFGRSIFTALSLLAGAAIHTGCSADAGNASEGPSERTTSALGSRVDVPIDGINLFISGVLAGSRIQVSSNGQGQYLGRGATSADRLAMSYFKAGPNLYPAAQDQVFNVPIYQTNFSGLTDASTFFATGGTVLVDAIDIRVNDLAADFYGTASGKQNPTFKTTSGVILADLVLTSGNPTVICSVDEWVGPPGLPVDHIGWVSCPSLNVTNTHVDLAIYPGVDLPTSTLKINGIGVTFNADLDAGQLGNLASTFYDWKGKIKSEVESKLSAKLNDPSMRTQLETALGKLIDLYAGQHVPHITGLAVDAAGLHATPGVCAAVSCDAQGGACGTTRDDQCGGTSACRACPPPADGCANDPCGDTMTCVRLANGGHQCKPILSGLCKAKPWMCP